MRGVILGSGVVAMLARKILGDDWTIYPFTRSRFYTFKPALGDNFVIRDKRIDDFIKSLGGDIGYLYKTVYSLGGELLEHSDELVNGWLTKVFGPDIPSHSEPHLVNRKAFFVYNLRLNQLYESMQQENIDYLKSQHKLGEITSIGDHHLIVGGNRVDFDVAISTIPLDRLCSLTRSRMDLPAVPVSYYHIQTGNLDFEGAHQLFVVEREIDFFKVANIAQDRYLFYCSTDIPNPGEYFMRFIKRFDLLDGTRMDRAIPAGNRPDLDAFKKMGIHCYGASAQWDWCMDVGSCILNMLKDKEKLQQIAIH